MTTTLTTMRTRAKTRLNAASTSAEPDDATWLLWCIDAFKTCMGVVPPVTEATATVSSSAFSATVVADQVFFVAYKSDLLLPSEWSKSSTTLHFKPGSVDLGGTITYWRFNSAIDNSSAALTDSSTSVNTTCIFGTDWLEPPATLMVMQRYFERMSSVNPSGDGPDYMATFRVYQDERDRILKPYVDTWNRWYGQMQAALQARVSLGDLPQREHAVHQFVNNSGIRNDLVGRR